LVKKSWQIDITLTQDHKNNPIHKAPPFPKSFLRRKMKLIMWFKCWMYGHEPNDDAIETFPVLDGVELTVSVCECCGSTIVYDEHLLGWVKW
jgi:hypothetical protein